MSHPPAEKKHPAPTPVEQPISQDSPANHKSISDCMAVERTVMANERTLLAYVRTSLAILVVAVTIIKFFQSQGMVILGYSLLAAGIICATIGLMRFTEMYHRLKDLGRCNDDGSDFTENDRD